MKKARVGSVAIALAALAAPLVLATESQSGHLRPDGGKWRPAWYTQKLVVPGPRLFPLPKDPETAPANSAPGAVRDAAGTAVGFSGGRTGTRTQREVERDSVRKTIRRLG